MTRYDRVSLRLMADIKAGPIPARSENCQQLRQVPGSPVPIYSM